MYLWCCDQCAGGQISGKKDKIEQKDFKKLLTIVHHKEKHAKVAALLKEFKTSHVDRDLFIDYLVHWYRGKSAHRRRRTLYRSLFVLRACGVGGNTNVYNV